MSRSVVSIGVSEGFAQRHYTWTRSSYCRKAYHLTGGLVRSPVDLEGIRRDLLRFGEGYVPQPDDPQLQSSIQAARSAFGLQTKVNPIHLNDLATTPMATDSSSPGLPWKQHGYQTKREVKQDPTAWQSIRTVWHKIKYSNRNAPSLPDCAAYVRAHLIEEGADPKVRGVWGYPATVGFMEATFALPLIDGFKREGSPMAYGYETARGGHFKILNRFGATGNFLGADFSSFDKRVPDYLIREAFAILRDNLDFSKYQVRGIPKPYALDRAWDVIVDYFINTPIRLADGSRYRKRSGVASGSYFTQLIDSIVNWIVIHYALSKMDIRIIDILVLGDDSLVSVDREINIEELDEHLSRLGMILNRSKTLFVKHLSLMKFLGYFITNGQPLKPIEEFWAALVHPETPDLSYDEYATRHYGLYLATLGQHQQFYDHLVETVQTPFSIAMKPSLRRYLNQIGIETLPARIPTPIQLLSSNYQ